MRPSIPEESTILINYFHTQQIKLDQLLVLLRILQQMNDNEFNINLIEFMIIEFVSLNPHFDQDYLKRLIDLFSEEFKCLKTT